MGISSEDFCLGMRQLGAAVNIITAHDDGLDYGLTATAVCSVTSEPPQVLVCINRSGATYKAIENSGKFTINTLSLEHIEVAKVFAGMSGKKENGRFHVGEWEHIDTLPVLKGALVSFVCAVNVIQNANTHGIIVGDVIDITIGTGKPLLYFDGAFSSLKTNDAA